MNIPTLYYLIFTTEWMQYAANNHHYTSLHEQDFLHYYIYNNKTTLQNAVIMDGFCMDIHAGSYIEHKHTVNLQKSYKKNMGLNPLQQYNNTWDGYKEWFVKIDYQNSSLTQLVFMNILD